YSCSAGATPAGSSGPCPAGSGTDPGRNLALTTVVVGPSLTLEFRPEHFALRPYLTLAPSLVVARSEVQGGGGSAGAAQARAFASLVSMVGLQLLVGPIALYAEGGSRLINVARDDVGTMISNGFVGNVGFRAGY